MREILFRGLCPLSGKFFYGSYATSELSSTGAIIINRCGIGVWAVNPETVGQYTGLTDFNGAKVFEGDKFHDGINYCVITWDDETASFRAFDGFEYHELGEQTSRATIIGNIHETK